jgi:hypothetical protein
LFPSPPLPRPHDGAVFFRTDLGAHYAWDEPTATWNLIGGGGGPTDAEYLVSTPNGGLSGARLVEDTATITWDFGTVGVAKANAVAVAHAASHQHGGADYLAGLVLAPAALSGNVNNYAPGSGDIWRLDSDANRDITGIGAPTDGRRLLIANAGSFTIRLMHQNAGSDAANRIICSGGANISLANTGQQALAWYDTTSTRWRASLL